MSYIRCGSNPEGLYIFGSTRCVEIYQGSIDGKYIPYHIWNGFFRLYHKNLGFWREREEETTLVEFGRYRGLECGEKWVDDKDGRHYKAYIRYNGWEIVMWRVTFEYIYRSVMETLDE